jgi:lycopene beta-cyclase
MNGRTCDLAIVGGGLSGSLAALALARMKPDITVRLTEAGEAIGGNHRWSWFGSDLSAEGKELLGPIRQNVWESGNEVAFPAYCRQLSTPYHSMSSPDLAAALERELPEEVLVLRRRATTLDATGVTLEDGTRISARAVVDARGFTPTPHLQGGWQVFMGRHIRLAAPHGIDRPTIMDARVEQLDGYRFVYVLPLSAHELFVEDTYYQDSPTLDRSALSARIDAYVREHGWDGEILGFETGVLPVVTSGDFGRYQAQKRVEGVTMLGAGGGFTHPLTSYTLPFAVQCALAIAADADLPGDQLAAKMEARARRHWNAMGFYRLLGSMLFGAAPPEQRVRVFQRFYRMPEDLIDRFYAGNSTLVDKARLLIGRPPVPIAGALRALTSKRPSLTHTDESRTA